MKDLSRKNLLPKFVLALFALGGMAVFAANNATVSRTLNIARPDVKVQISGSVQRDGKSEAFDTDVVVKAGETLNWKIVSANEGTGDAQNYRVVGQIPAGTKFVTGSANGQGTPWVTYSIDGGKTFVAEPMIQETQADGTVKEVPAPAAMFTQLRFEWSNPLVSSAKYDVTYRVEVK